MTERRQSLQIFNFQLLFVGKYKELRCWYSRGSGYATKIHVFLSRHQPFVFCLFVFFYFRKPNDKMKKIKIGPRNLPKRLPHQSACRCREEDFSLCAYRTSIFSSFFLTTPESWLAMKLVCLWFLPLAKQRAKWWDMHSYQCGNEGRV